MGRVTSVRCFCPHLESNFHARSSPALLVGAQMSTAVVCNPPAGENIWVAVEFVCFIVSRYSGLSCSSSRVVLSSKNEIAPIMALINTC